MVQKELKAQKVLQTEQGFFHISVFYHADGLIQTSYATILPDNNSRFSFTHLNGWWAPLPKIAVMDKKFDLIGKTKMGLFQYKESVNG